MAAAIARLRARPSADEGRPHPEAERRRVDAREGEGADAASGPRHPVALVDHPRRRRQGGLRDDDAGASSPYVRLEVGDLPRDRRDEHVAQVVDELRGALLALGAPVKRVSRLPASISRCLLGGGGTRRRSPRPCRGTCPPVYQPTSWPRATSSWARGIRGPTCPAAGMAAKRNRVMGGGSPRRPPPHMGESPNS